MSQQHCEKSEPFFDPPTARGKQRAFNKSLWAD